MNQPPNNNIDPRSLARNAKVVIQPAPSGKQIKMPARVQGLSTLPKPTDNLPPKPEQIQGRLPDASKTITNDSKQQPSKLEQAKRVDTMQDEDFQGPTQPIETATKKPETIPQEQNETQKTERKPTNLGEYAIKGGPGRPKKDSSIDRWLEEEAIKQHGRLPDGTTVTKAQMLAKTMFEKALAGNPKMLELVSNRLDGKPMQKIQITPPEEAEGTVLANEAQDNLLATFGRKQKHATDNSTTNQGA